MNTLIFFSILSSKDIKELNKLQGFRLCLPTLSNYIRGIDSKRNKIVLIEIRDIDSLTNDRALVNKMIFDSINKEILNDTCYLVNDKTIFYKDKKYIINKKYTQETSYDYIYYVSGKNLFIFTNNDYNESLNGIHIWSDNYYNNFVKMVRITGKYWKESYHTLFHKYDNEYILITDTNLYDFSLIGEVKKMIESVYIITDKACYWFNNGIIKYYLFNGRSFENPIDVFDSNNLDYIDNNIYTQRH